MLRLLLTLFFQPGTCRSGYPYHGNPTAEGADVSHPEILSEGFTSVSSPGCHPSLPPTHTHPSLPFQHSLSARVQLLHCWDWRHVKNERNQRYESADSLRESDRHLPSPISFVLHFTSYLLSHLLLELSRAHCQVYFVKGFQKIQMNDAVSPDTAKSIFYTFTVFDNFI